MVKIIASAWVYWITMKILLMRWLLCLWPFCFGTLAAQDQQPDNSRIQELCRIVTEDKRAFAPDPDGQRWPHRTILYAAAGIRPGTPDSIVARHMRMLWQQVARMPISAPGEQTFYFHQLLKLALQHRYGPLLLDAARWKVPLDEMDFNERKTLMDVLEDEFRNNTSDADAEWLREYKKILSAAGAKYFIELNYPMEQLAKRYTRIRPPVFGYYAVMQNNKWGWVDANNKIIIPIRYKDIRYTDGELFEVSENGKTFRWVSKELSGALSSR